MYGFIITKDIAAKNVDAWNRSVVAEVDVPAGAPLTIECGDKVEDPWTAKAPTGGALGDIWIAYPSSEALAAWEGKVYAGLSVDPRDYFNVKNRPFDAFKVKQHDLVGFTAECFDATLTNAAKGKFMEVKAGQLTWTIVDNATEGSTAFKICSVGVLPFPPKFNSVGMSNSKYVVGECVAE